MRGGAARLTAAVVCLALLCGCSDNWNALISDVKSMQESAAPAPREVTGTVSGATDGTMTVTVGGADYTFSITGVPVRGEKGIVAGCRLLFSYAGGALDAALEVQPGAVADIRVIGYPDPALDILKGMTVEQKVGQLLLVCGPGSGGAALIQKYAPGGFVLFGDDVKYESDASLSAKIAAWQLQSGLPLLVGVDEEGGAVNRVSWYPAFRSAPFPSPQTLWAGGGADAAAADAVEKAALLGGLGFNFNLAPVADVSVSTADFMHFRTVGGDAQMTAEYISAVVTAYGSANFGCALKHFPGYGSNADTHTGVAYDGRPLSAFEECDFIPFSAGIDAGAPAVLVSHNIVACFDPDLPASLSPRVNEVLRRQLGFEGVAITDELSMQGVDALYPDGQAAVAAVLAGCDLLCCFECAPMYDALIGAVSDGRISEDRLDESVLRILHWKADLGLIG